MRLQTVAGEQVPCLYQLHLYICCRGTESGKAVITPSTPVASTKSGSQLVPIDDVLFPVVNTNSG